MKYFLVSVIQTKQNVKLGGQVASLDLKWINGMIGVMPVFDNRKDAEQYADGAAEILEVDALGSVQ